MGVRKRFILDNAGLSTVEARDFDASEYNPDVPIKTSLLGNPVFSNLYIPPGTYETLDGDIIDFEGIEIDSILITVSMQKTIITTPTQGSDGTVKEYISKGDYNITFNGVLVSEEPDQFPESDFLDLIELLDAPISLPVVSEFLGFFNIDEIVVTNYGAPQASGSRDMQPFNFSALSDKPIELREI